jgi:hypothetical protein
MISNVLKVCTGVAWAALLVASAAPADATAVSMQQGNYAACSANYNTGTSYFPSQCGGGRLEPTDPSVDMGAVNTFYVQTIKMVGAACNGGGCNYEDGVVYTDMIYPTGRKVVEGADPLCSGYTAYQLGTCAC